MRKENCLDAIEEKTIGIFDDKWKEMDGNIIANLHLAIVDSMLSSILEKKIAKEIWDALTKLYDAKSLHDKIFLKRTLYSLNK